MKVTWNSLLLSPKEQNGDLAFVALSIDTYENLAINISELRRSANQQKEIIVHYEKAMKPDENNKTKLKLKLTETKYGKFIIQMIPTIGRSPDLYGEYCDAEIEMLKC